MLGLAALQSLLVCTAATLYITQFVTQHLFAIARALFFCFVLLVSGVLIVGYLSVPTPASPPAAAAAVFAPLWQTLASALGNATALFAQ